MQSSGRNAAENGRVGRSGRSISRQAQHLSARPNRLTDGRIRVFLWTSRRRQPNPQPTDPAAGKPSTIPQGQTGSQKWQGYCACDKTTFSENLTPLTEHGLILFWLFVTFIAPSPPPPPPLPSYQLSQQQNNIFTADLNVTMTLVVLLSGIHPESPSPPSS